MDEINIGKGIGKLLLDVWMLITLVVTVLRLKFNMWIALLRVLFKKQIYCKMTLWYI